MKALLVTLVAAALCFGLAHSRACFSCTAAINDRDCTSIQNCSDSQNYCETVVGHFLSIKLMMKRCASSCVNGNQDMVIANATEGCCGSDLCNTHSIGDDNTIFGFASSASSVKISFLAEATAVAVIGALFKLAL
ncbi:prostate stem cell antigen-like [Pleurodeles waltl]|uniref:prostate stem cell antigen-like n=1 Tax=Pleurodeles waltl TaxID=8319 RepID=UPI003709B6F9